MMLHPAVTFELEALVNLIRVEKDEYVQVANGCVYIHLTHGPGITLNRRFPLHEVAEFVRPMGAPWLASVVVPDMRQNMKRAHNARVRSFPTAH